MSYDTVIETIEELTKRGYTEDLNIAFNPSQCKSQKNCLDPKDFDIIETYRFEGESNPSDEDVVYAMASKNRKIKGIYAGAYGMYAISIF